MLYLKLLGTPEIYLDDQVPLRFRTRKAQALLIYLAVTERSWSRDALATLFWPETFETCRQILAEELAVEPDAETVKLCEDIKAVSSEFTAIQAAVKVGSPLAVGHGDTVPWSPQLCPGWLAMWYNGGMRTTSGNQRASL